MIRVVAFALALAFSSAAGAVDYGPARTACTSDVLRLCFAAVADMNLIVACLRREQAKLSPSCHAALVAIDRELRRQPKGELK